MDQGEQPSAAVIATWCRRWLGAEPTDILFHQEHLSQVTGLRLANGVEVVLKARPPSDRLAGCAATTRLGYRISVP